jgi:hypothetical protein
MSKLRVDKSDRMLKRRTGHTVVLISGRPHIPSSTSSRPHMCRLGRLPYSDESDRKLTKNLQGQSDQWGDGDAKVSSMSDVPGTGSFVYLSCRPSKALGERGIVTKAIVKTQKGDLPHSHVGEGGQTNRIRWSIWGSNPGPWRY